MKKLGWLLLILLICGSVNANLIFDMDTEFSGATAPSGPAPWAKAIFTTISSGNVILTMKKLNSNTDFISSWSFNLDPTLNPNLLNPTFVFGVSASGIVKGVDVFKADGDGKFDLKFEWGANVFNNTDTVIYTITSTEAITEDSFNFGSAPNGGNGSWGSAAHIQGIPVAEGETGSGWIGPSGGGKREDDPDPIPELSSFILFGIGLLGIRFRKR